MDIAKLKEKINQMTATEIADNPYYTLWKNGVISYEEFLTETVEHIKEQEK
jgi:hypothetical protein